MARRTVHDVPACVPRSRARRQPRSRVTSERLESRLLFAFGVTTGTAPTGQPTLVIDNGGDLKFSVIKGGNVTSTLHLGDVSSIQYKGQELLAPYSQTSRYSHYEQGLSSSTVITYTVNNADNWILVKCDDSAVASGAVIQYYAVRRNDNNIYMPSLPIDVTNGPGEGRFIAYLNRSVFTAPEAPSDNAGNTGAIEGSDVFGHADGTTTSKFYNMGRRMIENTVHGLTGTSGGINVGAWMYMGNREHSAGGPFFKDIDFQSGTAVEIYNCIFTGHTQTEPYRQGLHVYAFQFNGGAAPVAPDYSWMEALNLQGWIAAAQRGTLSGKATGVPAGHEVTVALSNTTAQYWTTPDASGNYTIAGVQPGTYTETLYDTELAVGTRTVTITAGATTRADITDTYFTPSAANTIWRIGAWDGTPVGFLNSDKIEIMHPSDVRMTSWTSTPNFVIGTNTDAQWPMVQFMGVNNSQRITFNLTSTQAATALTLRVGMTLGFEGGRVKPTVNAGQSYAWSPSNPAASTDLNSRGITRGTYRGPNQLYTWNIPTSALRAGTNTLDVPVISGSYVAGQTWLSPNVVYDAVDLVTTSSITNAPHVATITLSPTNPSVGARAQQQFTATAKDQFGAVTPANFTWTTTRGTIDDTGAYLAPGTTGAATVTATSGSVSGNASVNVTLTTVTGTGGDDVIRLVRNGSSLDVYVNSATPTFSSTFSTQPAMSILGLAGNDTLVIDSGGGSALPAAGVTFDGGGSGGGGGANVLQFVGAVPAGGGAVTLANGAFTLSAASFSDTAAASLVVNAGATLSIPNSQRLSSLSIPGGSAALAPGGGDKHLTLDTLSITAGGTLDLSDDDLILNYSGASPLAAIQALVRAARNGGAWDGAGLTSSAARSNASHATTLGAMEASDYAAASGGAPFAGETTAANSVLVKYTWYGDANFDGRVTFDDYVKIDTGFAQHQTGWTNGDFNGDGTVNFDDYVLIDIAFNSQTATLGRVPKLKPRSAVR